MNTQIADRAVVIGASIAGLLAAHALSDSYGQVTVIDRDELPETPTHRRGVPHGRHLHALAARGQQALEELLPGLTAALVADGAPAGDLLADARFYLSGHRLRQAHSGLTLLCASRPLLEHHIRTRMRTLPNLRFVDRCDVVGLLTSPDGHRVTGVRVLRRADGSADELLDADLVVDASGRSSRTAGMAGGARLPPTAAGAGADRARLRHPDLPAVGCGPRRQRGDPRRGDAAASADRGHAAPRGRPVDGHAGGHRR